MDQGNGCERKDHAVVLRHMFFYLKESGKK